MVTDYNTDIMIKVAIICIMTIIVMFGSWWVMLQLAYGNHIKLLRKLFKKRR